MHLKVSIAESAQLPQIQPQPIEPDGSRPVRREVWESAAHPLQVPVYRRGQLSGGWSGEGPAMIEEIDSTTFVPAGVALGIDENANLVLKLAKEE